VGKSNSITCAYLACADSGHLIARGAFHQAIIHGKLAMVRPWNWSWLAELLGPWHTQSRSPFFYACLIPWVVVEESMIRLSSPPQTWLIMWLLRRRSSRSRRRRTKPESRLPRKKEQHVSCAQKVAGRIEIWSQQMSVSCVVGNTDRGSLTGGFLAPPYRSTCRLRRFQWLV
jgi:hypothetical protein